VNFSYEIETYHVLDGSIYIYNKPP